MQSRRTFLMAMVSAMALDPREILAATKPNNFVGEAVFDRIVNKAVSEGWTKLPIGELMGKIALELKGTPYVANTLEISLDKEICSVNLNGLDCVTFFETTLDLARMLKKGKKTPKALLAEVAYTRYRGGRVGDYTSRLHYTTDWFYDNDKKRVVKLLSDLPGSQVFEQKVGYMSAHPDKYRQLSTHTEFVPSLKQQEDLINSRSLKYVPMSKLADVEPLLQTGDIVGVATSATGFDIAHTGLIFKDTEGVAHFMDASSGKAKMQVTIEPGPISKSLTWSKSLIGAMFARPLEP
ncbi:MAG TPA: N-acetylmuramoyl-L-alanine amidase-like domain-containing protein [Oculatellaceae cyanobacterium]